MTDEIQDHPQYKRFMSAVDRYIARVNAAHPDVTENGRVDHPTERDDYRLFGDLIEPLVLNTWNGLASTAYMESFREMLRNEHGDEDVDEAQALSVLAPVIGGMFEHIWLLGYLYRDEELKGGNE